MLSNLLHVLRQDRRLRFLSGEPPVGAIPVGHVAAEFRGRRAPALKIRVAGFAAPRGDRAKSLTNPRRIPICALPLRDISASGIALAPKGFSVKGQEKSGRSVAGLHAGPLEETSGETRSAQ